MSTFKRIGVHMLPTKEKAYTELIFREDKLMFQDKKSFKNDRKSNETKHFHLHFTSDDEIKDCDWYIVLGGVGKAIGIYQSDGKTAKNDWNKKIIATTDESLKLSEKTDNDYANIQHIKNLPEPSQSFIQKFVEEYNKGNVITEVMVECIYQYHSSKEFYGKNADWVNCDENQYNSIKNTIPTCPVREQVKINPKDNTITIRKIKDSWSREEVVELIHQFVNSEQISYIMDGYYYGTQDDIAKEWIEENL